MLKYFADADAWNADAWDADARDAAWHADLSILLEILSSRIKLVFH